jgi:polysaccharide transporter, PST family
LSKINTHFLSTLRQNKDYRQVATNAASMFVIQISNYLVPLITFPFLIRTLGIEGFGLMSFTQNIFSYFEQLMNYGFMYAAPKDIAQNTEDKPAINALFHCILYAKLCLLSLCIIILLPLFIFVPRLTEMQPLAIAGLSILLANFLQIDWFFQGIQKMKNITYANLLTRLVSLIFLFSFVKSPNNVAEAILSLSVSQILANLFLFQLAYRQYGVAFTPPQYAGIKKQLEEGFAIFSSQFLVRFYSADVNLTLLGFLTNNLTVGTYTLANKIFSLVVMTISPISAALYPYLAKLFSRDKTAFWQQFYRVFQLYAVVYVGLAIGLFIAADKIIFLINGSENATAAFILRLLSCSVAASPFGYLFVQVLLLHKKNKLLLYINLLLVAINICSVVPLFIYFREIGLAINSIIIHWSILGLQYLALKKLEVRS